MVWILVKRDVILRVCNVHGSILVVLYFTSSYYRLGLLFLLRNKDFIQGIDVLHNFWLGFTHFNWEVKRLVLLDVSKLLLYWVLLNLILLLLEDEISVSYTFWIRCLRVCWFASFMISTLNELFLNTSIQVFLLITKN